MLIGVISGRRRVPLGPSPLWSSQYFSFATAQWTIGTYTTYTHAAQAGEPAELVMAGTNPWAVKIAKGVTPNDTAEVKSLSFALDYETKFNDNENWDNPGFVITLTGSTGNTIKTVTAYPDEEFVDAYGHWTEARVINFSIGERPLFGDIKHITFQNLGNSSERITVKDIALNAELLVQPTGPLATWTKWYWNAFNHHIEGGLASNTAHPTWSPYKSGVAGQHEQKLDFWSSQTQDVAITPRNDVPLPAAVKAIEFNWVFQTSPNNGVVPTTFELYNTSDEWMGAFVWVPPVPLSTDFEQTSPVRIETVVPAALGKIVVKDNNPGSGTRNNRAIRDVKFIADDGPRPLFTSSAYATSGTATLIGWEAKVDKPTEQQLRIQGNGSWEVILDPSFTVLGETPLRSVWIEVEYLTKMLDGTQVSYGLDVKFIDQNDNEVFPLDGAIPVGESRVEVHGKSRQIFECQFEESPALKWSDIKQIVLSYGGTGGTQTVLIRDVTINNPPLSQPTGTVPRWNRWNWSTVDLYDTWFSRKGARSYTFSEDFSTLLNTSRLRLTGNRPFCIKLQPRAHLTLPSAVSIVNLEVRHWISNDQPVTFEVYSPTGTLVGSQVFTAAAYPMTSEQNPAKINIILSSPSSIGYILVKCENPTYVPLGTLDINAFYFDGINVDAPNYATWTGPGWFDVTDESTITLSGPTVTGIANKRSGSGNLIGGGGTTRVMQTRAGRGDKELVITRDTVAPVRFVAPAATAISQAFQGADKPFTAIVVYRPLDANSGYIWSASRTVDAANEHVVGLVRRATPNSTFRKLVGTNNAPDVNWGTGQLQDSPRIVAIRHTGTAVTVWDTTFKKTVTSVAQDCPDISTLAQFVLFAAQAKGSGVTYANVQSTMAFHEMIVETTLRTDVEIAEAMAALAAKHGIYLA